MHHTWWEKWSNEFKGKLFFSHGQRNSCEVTLGFIGNTSSEVSNKKQNESGRILILDVKVSDNDFLLMNLNNTNKKSKQLNTLSTLCDLLDDITNLQSLRLSFGESEIQKKKTLYIQTTAYHWFHSKKARLFCGFK